MSRGPTFWIVVLAIAAASTGLYLEHRRLNPPPPQGVTVSDVGELPPPATFLTVEGKPRQLSCSSTSGPPGVLPAAGRCRC
jgi:hypothetical protein